MKFPSKTHSNKNKRERNDLMRIINKDLSPQHPVSDMCIYVHCLCDYIGDDKLAEMSKIFTFSNETLESEDKKKGLIENVQV